MATAIKKRRVIFIRTFVKNSRSRAEARSATHERAKASRLPFIAGNYNKSRTEIELYCQRQGAAQLKLIISFIINN
jgi:hypothetical protein